MSREEAKHVTVQRSVRTFNRKPEACARGGRARLRLAVKRQKPGQPLNRSRSRGLTLMELLVVVAVMVILLGAALPLLKIGLAGRRTREVSRQLSTYVELAKSVAAETGREAGLFLQVDALPENGLPYVSEVFLAETPRPYAGDVVGARAMRLPNTNTPYNPNDVTTYPRIGFDALSASFSYLVHSGDQIKFDYRGTLYTLYLHTSGDIYFNLYPIPPSLNDVPLPPTGVALPYQIFRQPEKSSSAPLELASGAVIDLSMSGFGLTAENRFDNVIVNNVATIETESVVIVFSPSGQMTRVMVNKYDRANDLQMSVSDIPTGTLHLLIGGIDGVLLDDIGNVIVGDDLETNIENPDNLWVSIGHQSGRATTAENGWTSDDGDPTTLSDHTNMALARQFAQSSEAMGGR